MRRAIPFLLLVPLAAAAPAVADERNYMLTGFDSIRIEGPFEVEVTTGGNARAQASGDRRALDMLGVRVSGRTLVVAPSQNNWDSYPGGVRTPPRLVVSVPDLRAATVNGGGRLSVSRMRGALVRLALTGAGAIRVGEVDAERVDATLFGTGAVTLAGRARDARFQSVGAGAIDAGGLTVDALSVNVQSDGDARFFARDTATVNATGRGSVRIDGRPTCTVRGSAPVVCGEGTPAAARLAGAPAALGGIDIQRSQMMTAARWTKPWKWMVRRS